MRVHSSKDIPHNVYNDGIGLFVDVCCIFRYTTRNLGYHHVPASVMARSMG